MATNDVSDGENLEALRNNLARVEELSQRLVAALTSRNPANPSIESPKQELFAKAALSYWSEMVENPSKVFEHQVQYWGKSVQHFLEAQKLVLEGPRADVSHDDDPADRRFSNPMWETHPYFRLVKQQYQLNAEAIRDAVEKVDDLDPTEQRKLNYFASQIIDMMSPTNFLGTNPDALERAIETDGESLVKGLENLVADLEANNGEMLVKLADDSAFELGENIATMPGEVVFRNRMMELIQYHPTTEKVHETPIVMFPPWINKYYILDMKEKNSLIKWIVDQGYTLFVVSWINPDASYADVGMEDYITDGFLTAFDEVKSICGVKQVNAVGYCIAGTTLHLTLALMKKRKDKSVKSATFFTTLTDFSEQGEFTPFLQDDFIDGIEEEVTRQGILRSFIMSRTMSFLRSNDLIYTPAIKSYMMGEAPPAFDLLYWNGDGANLPGKMTVDYLRKLCQRNEFVTDGTDMLGETLRIQDVTVPLMSITCEGDHIAAWKDCYRGFQMTGSKDKTFVLAQSGHIAGIVNPPSKKKYGHYTNTDLNGSAEDWSASATFHDGSWWPRWEEWVAPRSGKMIPARKPGDSDHPSLAPAPGTYVRVKATG